MSDFKYIWGVKSKLSKQDRGEVDKLLQCDLPYGYARTIYKCTRCNKVMSSVYIPYGLSRGGGQNECLCMMMDSGFYSRSTTIKIGKQDARYAEQSK